MKKLFNYIKRSNVKGVFCNRSVLLVGNRIKIIVTSKEKFIKNKSFYYVFSKNNLDLLAKTGYVHGLSVLINEAKILKFI